MSSARFPGKVLAPLNGVPLIKLIHEQCQKLNNKNKVVILTSIEKSDDPVSAYLNSIDCQCYRGSLNNVFERFQGALLGHPCDYFVRLCADSPFINSELIDALLEKIEDSKYDLISNVYSRKFPKGQSVEIIKSTVFQSIHSDILTDHEREHVTPYFYTNKNKYNCLFLEQAEDLSGLNMCVDTFDDLKKHETSPINYVFDKSNLCIAKE